MCVGNFFFSFCVAVVIFRLFDGIYENSNTVNICYPPSQQNVFDSRHSRGWLLTVTLLL